MTGTRILPTVGYPELTQTSDDSFDLFATAVRSFAVTHGWPDSLLNQATHAAWAMEHGLANLLLAKRAPRARYEVDVDAMGNLSCSVLLAVVAAGASAGEQSKAADSS